jgi:3-deoxy-D-manno-octulosonic-acid transferase
MSEIVYSLGISLLSALYRIAAWFNPKAAAFCRGRTTQADALRTAFPLSDQGQLVWVHCASLGEFEQGRPVIEAIKAWRPSVKIFLTFFSPAGYEVRKNYPLADYIFYLPWDTRKNAEWFAENIRPTFAVFVKYEFWYHYSQALKKRHIPLISISAIFRPDQIYFKSHGGLFRKILRSFHFIFVQNQESLELLESIGITNAAWAGDTRFDRVHQIAHLPGENLIASKFKQGKRLLVVGSAWEDDMHVLIPFINKYKGAIKFIVAPHEINEKFLLAIEHAVEGNTQRYTAATEQTIGEADVLLINEVGMLSQLYRYGEFAFVGGGYKEGLHNILEAACYGIPTFFGDKAFKKFQEAVDLTAQGGAFPIQDFKHLDETYLKLSNDATFYKAACDTTQHYVQSKLGATEKIMGYCKKILEGWKGA